MFIERSKVWRKYLNKLNEEQRKEFYNKLSIAYEKNIAYQREYAKKYWEQQKEKELLECMKKYKRETIHIKSSFRKKLMLYINCHKLKFVHPFDKLLYSGIMSENLMIPFNSNIKFYNFDNEIVNNISRCLKHTQMLRYMRTKYPIEY